PLAAAYMPRNMGDLASRSVSAESGESKRCAGAARGKGSAGKTGCNRKRRRVLRGRQFGWNEPRGRAASEGSSCPGGKGFAAGRLHRHLELRQRVGRGDLPAALHLGGLRADRLQRLAERRQHLEGPLNVLETPSAEAVVD